MVRLAAPQETGRLHSRKRGRGRLFALDMQSIPHEELEMPIQTRNLAGRAGRWSADHWKTALVGWLALVAVAVFAGGAVGTTKQKDADGATGETAKAVKILDQ